LLDKRWLDLQYHDVDQKSIKKPDELGIDKKDFPPSIIDNATLDRILGSIFGMALGDALGAHVEFRPQSYLAANPVTELAGGGTWGLQKGQVRNTSLNLLFHAFNSILYNTISNFQTNSEVLKANTFQRLYFMTIN
jgi:hypothetical protein